MLRDAHTLSHVNSPSVFQKTRRLLSGVPQKGYGEIVERERERRRRHGETGIEKRDVDGQISLEQRKAEEHNPVE